MASELRFNGLVTGGPVVTEGVDMGSPKRRKSARLRRKADDKICCGGLAEAPEGCGYVTEFTTWCVRGGSAFFGPRVSRNIGAATFAALV